MELREILAEVPGLQRRFVYYLEARGLISPAKVQKERIARRDYSAEDLAVIRDTWRYYQRGYALQRAYELATASERAVAYAGVGVPREALVSVVERLREQPEVVEAQGVYGADWNLLLKIETADEGDIYRNLVPFLAEAGAAGLPQLFRGRVRLRREGADPKGGRRTMRAYVLMKVPGKDVDAVLAKLKDFEAVREASTVYGESDIVAKVEVRDQSELDTLVMERIHGIPAVESTRTFIVIGNLHWER